MGNDDKGRPLQRIRSGRHFIRSDPLTKHESLKRNPFLEEKVVDVDSAAEGLHVHRFAYIWASPSI